jgi:hypothetical protein
MSPRGSTSKDRPRKDKDGRRRVAWRDAVQSALRGGVPGAGAMALQVRQGLSVGVWDPAHCSDSAPRLAPLTFPRSCSSAGSVQYLTTSRSKAAPCGRRLQSCGNKG